MEKKLGVTLVITTMNELENMKWFMPQLKKEWYDELIIMDGGSTDGTVEFCKEMGYPIYNQHRTGLPDAFVCAFELSTQEIIIYLSPDGNSIAELIPKLADKIREGHDVAIASRYTGGAKSYDDDMLTGFGNKMFTAILNFLFKTHYTDTLIMYRAYRKSAVKKMGIHRQHNETFLRKKFDLLNSWELGSLMRAAKLNLKVVDIPADEPKRLHGQRKLFIPLHGTMALVQILEEYFRGTEFLKQYDRPPIDWKNKS